MPLSVAGIFAMGMPISVAGVFAMGMPISPYHRHIGKREDPGGGVAVPDSRLCSMGSIFRIA